MCCRYGIISTQYSLKAISGFATILAIFADVGERDGKGARGSAANGGSYA